MTRSIPPSQSELESFVSEFPLTLSGMPSPIETASSLHTFSSEVLESFFSELTFRLEIQSATQRQIDLRLARSFSVFGFIDPDENQLSDILAFLLNPKEAHGQEELFLSLLLNQIGRSASAAQLQKARVEREARTYDISKHLRRMDILLSIPGLTVAIENKVDAGEGDEQVADYLQCLRERSNCGDYCMIFLTPTGREPESLKHEDVPLALKTGQLKLLSYHKNIREWLIECRRSCGAENVRYFLDDFRSYLEKHLTEAV